MDRKIITFTVVASISSESEQSWLKSVRQIRKILKEEIGKAPEVKVLKIDSKEG